MVSNKKEENICISFLLNSNGLLLPCLRSLKFDCLINLLWTIAPDYQDNRNSDSPVDENSQVAWISILVL